MIITQKITSIDDLNSIRDAVKNENKELETGGKEKILVCFGGGCIASGAPKVKTELEEALKNQGQEGNVTVVATGCLGPCGLGPVVVMGKDKTFYQQVFPEDVHEIVAKHVMRNEVVERLTWKVGKDQIPVPVQTDIEFFKRQIKVVLRNCGKIDPYSIEDYIGCEGYQALTKVLTSLSSEEVIEEVKKSGLRGRGGAGFSTGMKWAFAHKSQSAIKYILCNADEGDPGAYMDRSVLEGDPHSVIEGMAIGAYAIGAKQGYVYVRAEYPLAVERLGKAIDRAREVGLLGDNILGMGFSFDLEIRMGSGAFVCGEETALIHSIEGKRGEPRPRPPFPAQKGLWGMPSLLNNVETYANISAIILKGSDWYAMFGTKTSKGTKVFALAGAVNNTGLVEVPMGTTLERIVYDIGGGVPEGKDFKAAQIGGPSGGCIPAEYLDLPLDYESVVELGAIMGSGGLIVMDEGTCMVDVARFFLEFVQEESCGKCIPCRIGTRRMLDILERICAGKGELSDMDELETLGKQIKATALCGLGQTAPNPVLSTIRHFLHEYKAHINDKYCPSRVCKRLSPAPCQASCPVGIDVPSYNALTALGRFDEALELIRQDNPFPGVCGRLCSRPCEANCTLTETDDAVAIRSLKRFLSDYERGLWTPVVPPVETIREEKIAVIGAGPAGLTAARDLRREGYPVTVFEAASKPGGMLRLAIPDYRLPPEVLDREIEVITASGVEIRTGVTVGKDVSIDDLRNQGYQAILIAIGAHKPLELSIPGDKDEQACLSALEFLKKVKLDNRTRLTGDVLVIGCTHESVDAARTAIRLGCPNVGLIYQRDRDQMPFEAAELKAAEEEGVSLYCLHQPIEVLRKNGKITGLKCLRLESQQPDKTGRARAVSSSANEVVIPAQTILVGIGQEPDLLVFSGSSKLQHNPWNHLVVDPVSLMTSAPGVFAAGDVTTGGATVIEAIAAGQKAAVTIHRFLRNMDQSEPYRLVKPRRRVELADTGENPEDFKRPQESLRPLSERTHDFREADLTFSTMLAICEAKRCLHCDLD